jgi:hypothetical protein
MACDPQLLLNLADAKAAYHKLQTGTMPRVVVDQNGERVEFTAANKANLYGYIQQLEAQVAACSGAAVFTPPANGPAGFLF